MNFSRRLSRLPIPAYFFSAILNHPGRTRSIFSRSPLFHLEFISSQAIGLGVLPGGRFSFSRVSDVAATDVVEGDWRSHVAAIEQSIDMIKRRLQVSPFFPSSDAPFILPSEDFVSLDDWENLC